MMENDVHGVQRLLASAVQSVFSERHQYEGQLIAIVGFDAAGKSTQVSELAKRFRETGKEVVETKQPTEWYRCNELVQSFLDVGGSREQAKVLALLAAVDRLVHVQKVILPALERGAVVICDRYVYATFAVFSHRGLEPQFIAQINEGIPEPDIAYFLDVPAEDLGKRLVERDGDSLKFEEQSIDRIESIVQCYRSMSPLLEVIDGTRPIEEVTDMLWYEIQNLQKAM